MDDLLLTKKLIYVILYENDGSLDDKPNRGVIDCAFEDDNEALLQAAKADATFPGVKHWVQAIHFYPTLK